MFLEPLAILEKGSRWRFVNGCVDDDRTPFMQCADDCSEHGFMNLSPLTAMLVGAERAALPAEHPMPEIILGDAQPACAGEKAGDGGFPASTRSRKDEDAGH